MPDTKIRFGVGARVRTRNDPTGGVIRTVIANGPGPIYGVEWDTMPDGVLTYHARRGVICDRLVGEFGSARVMVRAL